MPAGFTEKILFSLWGYSPHKMANKEVGFFLFCTIICIGIVEESAKLMAMHKAYRDNAFNEVMDGVVYGAAAAAGFATFENILYVMSSGYVTGVSRALLSVPGHVFFGAIIGFYLGLAKFRNENRFLIVLNGLIIAALFHGCYDFFLLTRNMHVVFFVIPLLIYAYLTVRKYIKTALNMSPFKVITNEMPKIFLRKNDTGRNYYIDMKRITGWLLINFSVFIAVGFLLLEFRSNEITGQTSNIAYLSYMFFCIAPFIAGIFLIAISRRKSSKE